MAFSSDFYNRDNKNGFLDFKRETMIEQSIYQYERLFAVLKQDEERYGMDFCNFNYDTLINVLSRRLSQSKTSRDTQLSLLRGYISWCIANKIKKNNENPILAIKAKDIDTSVQIRKQFIGSPEQLQEILDKLLASEKDEAIDVMYRMVVWLLYSGFTEEEILELEKDDVDFDYNVIKSHDGDKEIAMDANLRNIIKNVVDLDGVYRNSFYGNPIKLDLVDDNKLFRKIKRKDSANNVSILRSRLSLLSKKYSDENYEMISLSTKRLWVSGIFYRLYQRERNKEVLTNDDFKYDVNLNSTGKNISARIGYNKKDYENWKKAYDLVL